MDMDILRLMEERHSVRQFQPRPIEAEKKQAILTCLEDLQAASGLDIRFVEKADKIFSSFFMRVIGWNKPPAAYFAFVGEKGPETEEKCGYFGEKLVLFVQSLGLHTCWVGMFDRREAAAGTLVTIAVGYGETGGRTRKSKTPDQVSRYAGETPDWFSRGVKYALLAPTAVNRQGFMLRGEGDTVSISCRNGVYTYVDQGIIKYHFEQGAGAEHFRWA